MLKFEMVKSTRFKSEFVQAGDFSHWRHEINDFAPVGPPRVFPVAWGNTATGEPQPRRGTARTHRSLCSPCPG